MMLVATINAEPQPIDAPSPHRMPSSRCMAMVSTYFFIMNLVLGDHNIAQENLASKDNTLSSPVLGSKIFTYVILDSWIPVVAAILNLLWFSSVEIFLHFVALWDSAVAWSGCRMYFRDIGQCWFLW